MKKIALTSRLAAFGMALAVPALALAQTWPTSTTGTADTTYVDTWLNKGLQWLSQAITVVMVLMTLWFLINVFRYVMEKDAGKLAEKRKVMFNGLIGLFIAVSVWGIIRIAGNVFGTNNAATPNLVCPPGAEYNTYTKRCEVPRL